MATRDDIEETRLWSQYIVAWQRMVNALKERSSWLAWFTTAYSRTGAIGTTTEDQKQKVEAVHKTMLDNGW